MNTLQNQVTLIGNLGIDVELRTVANDRKFAKFSLATNQYYKNKDGEVVKETHWHNIVAWGKLAENLEKVLNKGDQVMVQGKLNYRNYEDSEGQKHYITEVVIGEFLKISKPQKVAEAA